MPTDLSPRHSEAATMPPFTDVVRRLTDLNLSFRSLITEGEWIEAARIERERFATLQELMQCPADSGYRRQLQTLLREMLFSDRALLDELQATRDHCLHELTEIHRGKQATKGYSTYAATPGRLQ